MTLFTNNYGSQALYRNNYSPCSIIIDLQMLHMSWLGNEAITLSHFCLNMINWVPLPDSHCTGETNQVRPPHPNPYNSPFPSPTPNLGGVQSPGREKFFVQPVLLLCHLSSSGIQHIGLLLGPKCIMLPSIPEPEHVLFPLTWRCSLPLPWYILLSFFRCQNNYCFLKKAIPNSLLYVPKALRHFLYHM